MVDLLVILVLLAAVVVFVSAPLRRTPAVAGGVDGASAEDPGGSEVGELEAARDAKLRELSDAELDHRTGKLSDEDFAAVDSSLRQEAITVLRALDEAREMATARADPDAPETALDTATMSD
jgi:hypothetical protein